MKKIEGMCSKIDMAKQNTESPNEIIKVYNLRSILSINFPNQIKMPALTTVASEYNKPN